MVLTKNFLYQMMEGKFFQLRGSKLANLIQLFIRLAAQVFIFGKFVIVSCLLSNDILRALNNQH